MEPALAKKGGAGSATLLTRMFSNSGCTFTWTSFAFYIVRIACQPAGIFYTVYLKFSCHGVTPVTNLNIFYL